MNPIERAARRLDRFQQGFAPAAFVFGVMKKFGDDRAGSLAALIAYYGFLSLFPLLLLLFTVVGMVAGSDHGFARSIESSALAQFPVVGKDLGKSISTLHRNSAPGLVVGVLGLAWGSQGAIQAGQFAMAQVWNVPGTARPGYLPRLARTGIMMVVLAVFLILSTATAGSASFVHGWPAIAKAGTVVASLALNIVLYLLAFRVLTPKQIGHRGLVPGAMLGGAGWTVLQYLGTLVVEHSLRGSSQVYGFFAIVLGLLAWIYLGAELTLYAAELNVVHARRLWPRGLVQPPLTPADRRVLAAISKQDVRRPEQHVSVHFATEDVGAEGAERSKPEGAPEADGAQPEGAQPGAPGADPANRIRT